MKKRYQELFDVILIIVLLLLMALICYMIIGNVKQSDNSMQNLKISGERSYDGGPWEEYHGTKLEPSSHTKMIIKGNVQEEINDGDKIYFFRENLAVTIFVNDYLVFIDDGQIDGGQWSSFISNQITSNDIVEIQLEKTHSYEDQAFTTFFDSIYHGNEAQFELKLMKLSTVSLLSNLFLLLSCMILMIISAVLILLRQAAVQRLFLLTLLVFSCSLWLFIRIPYIIYIINQPTFIYLIDVISQFMITLFALAYIRTYTTGKQNTLFKCYEIWTMGFIIIATILTITTNIHYHEIMPLGAICNLVFMISAAYVVIYEVVVHKNKELRQIILAAIPFLFCGCAEVLSYILSLNVTTTFFFYAGLLSFLIMQLVIFIRQYKERADLAEQNVVMNKKLNASYQMMVQSQIKPHFLYNTLTTIRHLCLSQPKLAANAIGEFAAYLRGNMDALSEKELVSMQQEYQHLQHYVAIEALRFPEIEIVYDLRALDFKLPVLTLQPLVENAIKYGVSNRSEGGKITIKTWEDETYWYLCVHDNGIGFDPTYVTNDGRSHIGIQNTKQRITIMCHGELHVESSREHGTNVTITLPKHFEP